MNLSNLSEEELYSINENWKYLPKTHNWIKALELAKEKHEGQLRDEGTPYFTHLLGTVEILIKEANILEDDVLTVAALHDILEDTDCTYEELKEIFGKDVADSVKLLTRDSKNGQLFEDYAKTIFENQNFSYIKQVKLADRLHNLRSLLKSTNEKIKRKIEETEKYILIYDDNESLKVLMDKIKEQLYILKSNQNLN